MTRSVLLAAALAAGLTMSVAAEAKPTPVRSGEVWHDIVQLENDVNRADARDTISEREAESQAMWPSNAVTSGTTIVERRAAAVPHTPRPNAMRTHAGCPWKGPTISSRPPPALAIGR